MKGGLTVNEIKANYPDEWVLVGNPEVSVASLTAGVVIWHGKDKRDLLKTEINWRERYESAMTFLRGKDPKISGFCFEHLTIQVFRRPSDDRLDC